MEVSGQLHATAMFYPWEKALAILLIGGWLGLRAILDAVA